MFAFTTDLMRSVGTHIYGRRMYDTMAVWETEAALADQSDLMGDFATAWQAADKIVYSTTLDEVASERTRIERTFDPDSVRKLKSDSDLDLTIDGPNLAAQAIRAGLVDEYKPTVGPAIVGGGNRYLPDDVRVDLELLDERRFGNGVVYLRYRTSS